MIPEDLSLPGTHALVIGVSAYEFLLGGANCSPQGRVLDIGQLSAAARSASEFAAWLMDDYHRTDLPLRSLRVLLSPSPGETIAPSIERLLSGDWRATRENVEAMFAGFMAAVGAHKDKNVAIVYVAGHGVQFSSSGAVLLLNDIADPSRVNLFNGAVDMRSMHNAMNNDQTSPQTQFWFVDMCRGAPGIASEYEKLSGVLEFDKHRSSSVRTSPLFLSASSGQSAFARPNHLTLFCEALLRGLREGHAARPEKPRNSTWHVSVSSLVDYLPDAVQDLAENENVEQMVEPTGKVVSEVFHECLRPPEVDLTLSIHPSRNSANHTATIEHAGKVLYRDHGVWPINTKVTAGLYTLDFMTLCPPGTAKHCLDLHPPRIAEELPL